MKPSVAVLVAWCSLLILAAACTQKDTIRVTDANKRDVLTAYGKQNPEKDVIIETDFGNMQIRLYDETPLHRANFIKLIKDGYYGDSEFYRIVEKFVVQGGVPLKKLDYTIPAEFNPKYFHKKGAVAMARLDENNPGKESSSTEFYIAQGSKYADWEFDDEARSLGLTLPPQQRKNIYIHWWRNVVRRKVYSIWGSGVRPRCH